MDKAKRATPPMPSAVPLCVPAWLETFCFVEWCVDLWAPSDPDFLIIAMVADSNHYGIAYFPDVSQPGIGVHAYEDDSCDSITGMDA